MDYSALITERDSLDSYKKIIQLLIEDVDCKQVVVICSEELLVQLIVAPMPKVLYVKKSKHIYMTLLNGLKAVSQENVLVIGKDWIQFEQIEQTKKELNEYPAIYYNDSIQGFDTRLVMFCLQMAIEINLEIKTYANAVEALGDTPLKYIKH